jgi:hypothetical protein
MESFKLWLCIEEIYNNIRILTESLIQEALGNSYLGAEETNQLISNMTGVNYDWVKVFAGKARSGGARSDEALQESIQDMIVHVTVTQKEKIVREIERVRSQKTDNKGQVIENKEAEDLYIRNYVINMAEYGRREAYRQGVGDDRRLLTLKTRYEKLLREGKPFTDFGSRGEYNSEAKEYFKDNISGKPLDKSSFIDFLRQFSHKRVNEFGNLSISTTINRRDGEEGEISQRDIVSKPVSNITHAEEIQNKIIEQLRKTLANINPIMTPAKGRNLENAIKIAGHLNDINVGAKGSRNKALGDLAGISDPNQIHSAMEEIRKATQKIAYGSDDEVFAAQVSRASGDDDEEDED